MKIEKLSSKRFGIGQYACGDTLSGDGRVLIDVNGWYRMYSPDNGASWTKLEALPIRYAARFVRLADGTFFGIDFNNVVDRKFNPKQEKAPFIARLAHAESFDDILNGNINVSFAPIDIPSLAVGYGDSGVEGDWFAGAVDHGIIQLENGDIIATMYGQFKDDKTKVDYFKQYSFCQYRSWCVISHDGGHTFEFLSVMADVQTYPIDPAAEGYCEAELLSLGGGEILAMLRTQGHEVYSPLYTVRSHDGGKSWSKPKIANDYGVNPRLVKLENGLCVCASGKYHNFIIVSDDDGETWSEPFILRENDGKWDRGPSGYPSLFACGKDELMVVYDDPEDRVSEFENPFDRRIVFIDKLRVER